MIAQRQSGTGFRKLDAHHRAHQVDAAVRPVRARSKGNYEDPDHEADQDGHEHQLDTAMLGRGRHPLIIYRGYNAASQTILSAPRIPLEQIADPLDLNITSSAHRLVRHPTEL